MQDLNDKVTGNTLTAAEWNEIPSEIQNVIEGLGITLSGADLNQLGKAIAGYVANGIFYADSGSANAYVLSVIGSKQAATAYTDGMVVNFISGNVNTGASTVNVAGLGVKNIKTPGGLDLLAGTVVGRIKLVYDLANGRFEFKQESLNKFDATTEPIITNDISEGYIVGSKWIDVTNDRVYACTDNSTGSALWRSMTGVAQTPVSLVDGSVATGTTQIPLDNTIPQNTEGDEYMVLSITPKNPNNILNIEVVTQLHTTTNNTQGMMITCLFQDAIADAIAVIYQGAENNNVSPSANLNHYMVAGSTSLITFKVRCGYNFSGTTTLNGLSGGGAFGGKTASSLSITEYIS